MKAKGLELVKRWDIQKKLEPIVQDSTHLIWYILDQNQTNYYTHFASTYIWLFDM